MGRRARASRKFTDRGGNNYIWTVGLIDEALVVASPFNQLNIVTDADWSVVGGQRTCTVMSVRGWLTFRSVGVLDAFAAWYITTQDADEIAVGMDPLNPTTYVEEDILYTGGFAKPSGTGTGSAQMTEQVNVKSKRKLKSGRELRLVAGADAVDEIHITGIFRCLLKLNES